MLKADTTLMVDSLRPSRLTLLRQIMSMAKSNISRTVVSMLVLFMKVKVPTAGLF